MLQHVDQFRVVDFQQHSCDFSSQFREHALNQWEQTFAQHLFLLARWRLSQHTGGQRLLTLDKYSCLGWLGLLLLLLLLGHHHLGLLLARHNRRAGDVAHAGSVFEVGSSTGLGGCVGWHAWAGLSHGGGQEVLLLWESHLSHLLCHLLSHLSELALLH